MNPNESLNLLFDGVLPEQEADRLRAEIADDPELAAALESIESMAEFHRNSMPADKGAAFIEAEWNGIQSQLSPRKAAPPPSDNSEGRKLLGFPQPTWLRSTIAIAAALTLTITGLWVWTSTSEDGDRNAIGQVAFVQTDIDGASSMIFMDEQSGWTFVWIDEPLHAAGAAG